jgi:hypothetical protein
VALVVHPVHGVPGPRQPRPRAPHRHAALHRVPCMRSCRLVCWLNRDRH